MVQFTARAGVDTYLLYGTETTYGTEASSLNLHFGIVQSVTPNFRNNIQRIRGMKGVDPTANTDANPRDAKHQVAGRFEGTVSSEFQPQHFKWLTLVLGSTSGTGTAGSPAIYPAATGSASAYLDLPSATLSTNFEFGGSADAADKAWHILGCKVTSCTIRAAVGEPLSVSLEFQIGGLAGDATLVTQVALDAADVYYFVGANVEYPDGTDVPNIIEGFELTITNGLDPKHGCGTGSASRTVKAIRATTRDFSLRLNLTAEGTQFMDDFMGGATALGDPTEVATVTLALTGDTDHTCDIVCYGCRIDEESMPQTYPDTVTENVTLIPNYVIATEVHTAT